MLMDLELSHAASISLEGDCLQSTLRGRNWRSILRNKSPKERSAFAMRFTSSLSLLHLLWKRKRRVESGRDYLLRRLLNRSLSRRPVGQLQASSLVWTGHSHQTRLECLSPTSFGNISRTSRQFSISATTPSDRLADSLLLGSILQLDWPFNDWYS
jgi:hypothetical protein